MAETKNDSGMNPQVNGCPSGNGDFLGESDDIINDEFNDDIYDRDELEQVLKDLDIDNLKPNREIAPPGGSSESDADSSSEAASGERRASGDTSSVRSRNSNVSIVSSEKTDEIWAVDDESEPPKSILKRNSSDSGSSESTTKKSSSSSSQAFKKPMEFLRNMRRKSLTKLVGSEAPKAVEESVDYSSIVVNSLPQRFVCKYLGHKPVRGLHGIKHVRNQIDILVDEATHLPKGEEVPLAQLTIWEKGIQTNAHPKTKNPNVDQGVRPIDFVTFCVQDVKFFKVVAFIYITEISKTSKKAECHAYVCDSPLNARRLALSVSLAFQRFAKRLGEKRPKMQVDLRTVDEIELDLKTENNKDSADSDA